MGEVFFVNIWTRGGSDSFLGWVESLGIDIVLDSIDKVLIMLSLVVVMVGAILSPCGKGIHIIEWILIVMTLWVFLILMVLVLVFVIIMGTGNLLMTGFYVWMVLWRDWVDLGINQDLFLLHVFPFDCWYVVLVLT